MPQLSLGFSDAAIYALHYRGYAGSAGEPSQDALFSDALALFDQVRPEHPDILVVGRSLGSGVAVYLSSMRPVSRLVLVTPFDSLLELAAPQFPYIPVRWLLMDKFESWRYAPNVSAPTTIVVAELDEIVPRENSELLRSRFKAAAYRIVAGVGHNTITKSPDYLPALTTPP
jgi:pimeloyl-ACP methyl ester carboxylesterase